MLDLSLAELAVVAAAGLLVLGPKELPVAARYIRGVLRSVRETTADIRAQVNDVLDADEGTQEEASSTHTTWIEGDDGRLYQAYQIASSPDAHHSDHTKP